MSQPVPKHDHYIGFAQALAALLLWGVLPVYWKWLSHVPSLEILLHRIIWSAVALGLYFACKKRFLSSLLVIMRNKRVFYLLALNGVLISANWLTYIWAVNAGYVLETSLGYFICPIFSVLLGAIILKERLSRLQWLAVTLVSLAILASVIRSGYIPWIAIFLAASFSCYSLIKKSTNVGSIESLWIETALTAVPSIIYLTFLTAAHKSVFFYTDTYTHLLLVGCGVVTATPLLLFGWAARRLRLSTLGFMQFITPSMQFLLAVFYFEEGLDNSKLVTFSIVWCAIALYLAGSKPKKK